MPVHPFLLLLSLVLALVAAFVYYMSQPNPPRAFGHVLFALAFAAFAASGLVP